MKCQELQKPIILENVVIDPDALTEEIYLKEDYFIIDQESQNQIHGEINDNKRIRPSKTPPSVSHLECDPDKYWTLTRAVAPKLAEYGHLFCSLPASTADTERIFSSEAWIHNKLRNKLSDKSVEKLLTLYNNLKFNDCSCSDSDE